ncbi:MAG: helicase, partial [Alphaproteobacteria bacterium]|nr:helicase [Alphaproteobacteria bacterium]
MQSEKSKDYGVYFEELGIDRLYVDEAHFYKNLFVFTKLNNVAGVQKTNAQKSMDMLNKCMYINEITDYRGVVFATGTPVSNSMVELFTMQRYLQSRYLEDRGIIGFDDWVSRFGKRETAYEISPEGSGYREKTRLARYYNLNELMLDFGRVADIVTDDVLDLDVPEVEFCLEELEPSEEQKIVLQDLANRAEAVHNGCVDRSEDNMLKITTAGKMMALDLRLLSDVFEDDPNSKINKCVENVVRIYNETTDKRSTQLIFCDTGTPTGKNKSGFNVYKDIKEKLISLGVKEEEIAFVHDATDEEKREELFDATRQGKIRILLGSTQKLGVGTNVQDRLIASHDLDVPWRPADLEQRRGRIVRQGNTNDKVQIYRYVTKGTFDSYLWQTLENKQRYISQIMTSKDYNLRELEEVDEVTLTYGEIKAIAAGNPLISEKMQLDVDLKKLTMDRTSYLKRQDNERYDLRHAYPQRVQRLENYLKQLHTDLETVRNNPDTESENEKRLSIVINDKAITNRKDAAEALLDATKMINVGVANNIDGEYRGLKLTVVYNSDGHYYEALLTGQNEYLYKLGMNNFGKTVDGFVNIENKIQDSIEKAESLLVDAKETIRQAEEFINTPYARENEYKEKSARSAEILEQLLKEQQNKYKRNEEETIDEETNTVTAKSTGETTEKETLP